MKMTRNAARLLSAVMAFVMVLALAAPARADNDAVSVELVLAAEGIEASGKLIVSPELVMSIGVQLLLNGESFADLTGYASTQAVAVRSGFLDKTYGVDLATLAENLKTSIFAPDSGSQFALDEDSYNQLQALLSGSLQEELPDLSGLDTDALTNAIEVLGAAGAQAFDDIRNKLALESAPATVSINGQNVLVSQTRITVSTEALIAFYDSLLTALEQDAELQKAAEEFFDFFALFGFMQDDLSIPDGATAVQTILENMDEVRQTITDELTQAALSVSVVTCTTENAAVKVALEISVDDETVSGALLMNEAQDFFRLEMVDVDGTVTALQFDVTVDTDLAYGFHFGSYQGDDETFAIVYSQDNTAQTYDVAVTTTDTDYETGELTASTTTVSGSYVVEDELFSLIVDKVDGEAFGGTVTLNIRTNDTVTMPTFSELTRLEETEFATVVESLQSGLTTITQLFGTTPAA